MLPPPQLAIAAVAILVIVLIGYFAYRRHEKRSKFGDIDNWPGAGTFGNMADTNPYGNYADSQSRYWPSMSEYAAYWTSS